MQMLYKIPATTIHCMKMENLVEESTGIVQNILINNSTNRIFEVKVILDDPDHSNIFTQINFTLIKCDLVH